MLLRIVLYCGLALVAISYPFDIRGCTGRIPESVNISGAQLWDDPELQQCVDEGENGTKKVYVIPYSMKDEIMACGESPISSAYKGQPIVVNCTDVLMQTFKLFAENTNIRFVERNEDFSPSARLNITTDSRWGCTGKLWYDKNGYETWSNFPSGGNYLNLELPNARSWECFTVATIFHELMHVLGFPHMHQHPSREDYVTINWENIDPAQCHNFQIYEPWPESYPWNSSAFLMYGSDSFIRGDLQNIYVHENERYMSDPKLWGMIDKATSNESTMGWISKPFEPRRPGLFDYKIIGGLYADLKNNCE